ncbi:MAG: polymerase subunit delta, partial [Proteobacteria bacterium]|nr:polymerase subunit delta [Pseudomonadota bacterium]
MPQLRPEQLSAHLAQPLAALYVLHGNEPLLVAEAGDAVRAAARTQGYTEREVLVAGPTFKWDDLHLAAGNLSLFGERKVIDLRIPNGKPGREGTDALARYCGRLGADIVSLITLPQLDWQARKTSWFATLQQVGVVIELNAPELPRLPEWVAQRLARQQQSAPREALEFIAAHVEGNLLAAHQEIQKLGLLHPSGALSFEQVEDAVLNVARYLRAPARRPAGRRRGGAAGAVGAGDGGAHSGGSQRQCGQRQARGCGAQGRAGVRRTQSPGNAAGAGAGVVAAAALRPAPCRSHRSHDQGTGAGRRVGRISPAR